MQKFELIIKNNRKKNYRLLFLLFTILNGVFVLYSMFYKKQAQALLGMSFLLLIIITLYLIDRFIKKRKSNYNWQAPTVFYIIFSYLWLKLWWLAIAFAVISFLYIIAIRPLSLQVSASELIFPSWPKRQLSWTDLSHIILKDGLLTIDFKNNKIIQCEIVNGNDENEYELDEKEFNDFCKAQLNQ